jgi:hypothetical protein
MTDSTTRISLFTLSSESLLRVSDQRLDAELIRKIESNRPKTSNEKRLTDIVIPWVIERQNDVAPHKMRIALKELSTKRERNLN